MGELEGGVVEGERERERESNSLAEREGETGGMSGCVCAHDGGEGGKQRASLTFNL